MLMIIILFISITASPTNIVNHLMAIDSTSSKLLFNDLLSNTKL